MKIVQINSSCGSGSTGKIALAIKKELDKLKIENYIFYSGYKINEYENCIPINTKKDIRKHQIMSLLFGNQGWNSVKETKILVKKLNKIKPDIVHLHNLHGYYLNMDILFEYLKKNDISVVWTLHDCWAFTGHCSYFTSIKCEKWKTECKNCPQIHAYPYSLLLDNSSNLFKKKDNLYKNINNLTITTVSKWLKNITSQSYLLKERTIKVIPNGIDVSVFKPTKRLTKIKDTIVKDKKVILGVASTWSERKGLDKFCQIRKLLSDEYVIVLIGLNDKQIKELPEGIIGLNRTKNVTELVELYSTANVFFNSSIEETFGLTTIEAISCGTPAIVYNSTACPETIVSEKYGSIVQPEYINEVVNKIKFWCNKNKSDIENELHNYIEKNFDERKVYEQYIDLYEEINK